MAKLQSKKIKNVKETPTKRYMHSAVLIGKYLVIYGGMDVDGNALPDTWIFDIEKKKWKHLTKKQETSASSSSVPNNSSKNEQSINQRLINEQENEAKQEEGNKKQEKREDLTKTQPYARWGSTMTMDMRGIVTLFGGHDANGQFSDVHVMKIKVSQDKLDRTPNIIKNDINRSDPTSVFSSRRVVKKNVWYRANTINEPSPRYCHGMIQRHHFLYVFGGYPCMKDTTIYRFDLLNKNWQHEVSESIEGRPIKGRWGHTCTLSNDETYMIVAFGRDHRGCHSDLYSYHFGTQTWVELTTSKNSEYIPEGRYGHSAVMSNTGSLFVFGGILQSGHKTNELMEFNFNFKQWRRVDLLVQMIPRAFHTAVMTSKNQMILFGGEKENRSLVAGLDEIVIGITNKAPPNQKQSTKTRTVHHKRAEQRRMKAIKTMHKWSSSKRTKKAIDSFTSPPPQFSPFSPSRLTNPVDSRLHAAHIRRTSHQQMDHRSLAIGSSPNAPHRLDSLPSNQLHPISTHQRGRFTGSKRFGGGFRSPKDFRQSSLIMNRRPSPISGYSISPFRR